MQATHPRRGKRRHGHLPGHVRNAFIAAVEAYEATNPGEKPPRVLFEVEYRDRTISVAQACGLVWYCTDVLPGTVFDALCGILDNPPRWPTYAAAAKALLAALKVRGAVNAGFDAQLSRLYNQRDAARDRLEEAIAAERDYDLTSDLGRWQAAAAASKALEAWEGHEILSQPKTEIEQLLQRHYEFCGLIARDALNKSGMAGGIATEA
jgi:hypothetical protein